jgi:hypothetical protein
MILVAGGDSFIFGAELADQHKGTASKSTFPALLAAQADIDYSCAAISGNANNAITRTTLAECERLQATNELMCVIITWTFTQRFEFRFNYPVRAGSPWHSINSWTIEDDDSKVLSYITTPNKSILRALSRGRAQDNSSGVAEFAKTFYKHVGDSEYYELYSSLKEIVFMQNYLKLNNIPYLFIPADTPFYQHENYLRSKDQDMTNLYNQIDWTNWFFFPASLEVGAEITIGPRGFYQWAVENKYSVGSTHPLEEAHIDAAKLIKEKFDEMVTKHNQSD